MNNKKQGILFIILSSFFFSLMTLFIRLSGDLPTLQKAFFRNLVAMFVSIFMLARSKEKFHINKSSWFDLFMRCFFGTVGLICNFTAIDHLNLADANMLNKLSPFFAIIMSTFVLKEKANKTEWAYVIIAFLGSLFIIKPSFSIETYYGFLGMMGGLGAGIAYTYVRKLGTHGERGTIIVFSFSAFSCLVLSPNIIFNYHPMTTQQIIYLLLAGCSATGGQLCITKAYTKAPAKEISVYDYSQIVFAALWGFAFLDQIPDIYSFIGYIIIIGTSIFKWKYVSLHSDHN